MEGVFSRDGWHLYDSHMLSDCVKTKLVSDWQDLLRSRSIEMSRMRLFYDISDFDQSISAQPYINIRSRQKRSVLAKLRMGTLPIKIETGRYRSISEDQRICDNCNLNEVENEKHFVYHCTKHQNIREIYLDNLIDDDNNDVDNLKMIFSDFEKSKEFATYLIKGLDNRIK